MVMSKDVSTSHVSIATVVLVSLSAPPALNIRPKPD